MLVRVTRGITAQLEIERRDGCWLWRERSPLGSLRCGRLLLAWLYSFLRAAVTRRCPGCVLVGCYIERERQIDRVQSTFGSKSKRKLLLERKERG